MEIPIMSLDINNEMDIMLAHRRGMQFAKFSGINLPEQTRFATAVSEISRNCMEYAFNGNILFSVLKIGEKCILQAIIQDEGKGIKGLDEILQRTTTQYKGRGLGIVYAKRLADQFKILSSAKGTTVTIQKNIPLKAAILINKLVVQGWVKHLQNEPAISAYEELKMRNIHLVELTEELRANALMVEKQMEEITKLNNRLSLNNDRMKAFTYAISHDLKTPLTNLKLSSAYMVETPLGEDRAVFQGILTRSVSRLDRTIHSLIEILDIQHQEQQVVKELDIAAVFAEIQEELEVSIKQAQATIQSDFTKGGSIRYIGAYFQSILRNLLSNSLKYKDPERPLHITVKTKKSKDGIQLIFSDTASGMDINYVRDRLFIPFTRFSNVAEGKGIGLYMIKSMIENNGGTVTVDSKAGEGTSFHFNLVAYE